MSESGRRSLKRLVWDTGFSSQNLSSATGTTCTHKPLRLLQTRNGGFDEWMLSPVGGAASGDVQPRFNERLRTLYRG